MTEDPAIQTAPHQTPSADRPTAETVPMDSPSDTTPPERKWRPLPSLQRRVIGVLVEKAKTTPDAYPLSLNALVTGCNQKSNREPQMNLSADQVEDALEKLREMGAVAEVQTGGRVPKYRHYIYEWLGVDKQEIAVMTELLLRGAQTVGELRGRAARMEPIASLEELRPIVCSLIEKGLVMALTPEGRGQIVTHTLYREKEIEEIKAKFAAGSHSAGSHSAGSHSAGSPSAGSPSKDTAVSSRTSSASVSLNELQELRGEVSQLRQEVAELREQLRKLIE